MFWNFFLIIFNCLCGLPRWLSGKDPPANMEHVGDLGLIPGSGRSFEGGNGIQYWILENTPVFSPGKSRGQRSLAGSSTQAAESDMAERLSTSTSWFTTLCEFQMYSKVIQINIIFFFRFFSIIGYYNILNILPSRSLLVVWYIWKLLWQ